MYTARTDGSPAVRIPKQWLNLIVWPEIFNLNIVCWVGGGTSFRWFIRNWLKLS